jgi:magnesium chelatase family protein
MTIARVATFAFSGIEAVPVEVQVQVAAGLPAFLIAGPDCCYKTVALR